MSGLHSTVQFNFPATMASNAPLTPSMETIGMSLPGFDAGFFHGLDRAERHVIVMGITAR